MERALKIIFAGTPEFALTILRNLLQSEHQVCAVYTQPDRPAGRGRKLASSPVKELALEAKLPVHQPVTLKHATEQQRLHEMQADLMVVVAYGLILPPEVLTIPRFGCINIHASLLPRWRGAAPIQRAILAGDKETGITLIQMNEGLDTGDMLSRVACPINADDTAAELHDRLAELGARSLLAALTQLSNGELRPVPQDDNLACYAPKIEKSEAQIDWSHSAVELERRVRAFNPWPVAYTTLPDETRLRIWRAQVLDEYSQLACGTVIATGKAGIDIATKKGVLRLLNVQLPGGRPVSAADFLNAHPVNTGVVLGRQGDQTGAG